MCDKEVVTSPEIQIRKATPFTYLTMSLPSGDSVCGYTTGFTSIQSVNGIPSIDFTIVYVTDNSLEPERTQILSSGQYLPRKRQIIKAGNYQAWNNSEFGYLGNNIRICS